MLRPLLETINLELINPDYRPKPPLGLMPAWRWKELRQEAIREAIARYEEADMTVPAEWRNELYQLAHIA